MTAFDDVLKNVVGDFGVFQKRSCILLAMVNIMIAMTSISTVFIQADTHHWCKVPDSDMLLETCESLNVSSNCVNTVRDVTIPRNIANDGCQTSWKFSSCFRYENVTFDKVFTNFANNSVTTRTCDHGWEYDTTQYKSTVIQEFDLVCDRSYLNAVAISIQIAGIVVGNIVYGPISDRIGRMKTFTISLVQLLVCAIIEATVPFFAVFVIFRFAAAMANHGMYMTTFILMTEMVGPSKRGFVSAMFFVSFAFGYMALVVVAYIFRHWRHLILAISLPSTAFFLYSWFISESARWLLAVGKTRQAETVMRRMARVNGMPVSDDMFTELNGKANDDAIEMITEEKLVETNRFGVFDLFRYPHIRKKTIIVSFQWFCVSLTYYGLVLSATSLAGNDYVNVAIAGAVEVPAYVIISMLIDTKLGRRFSYFGTSLLTGMVFICIVLVPKCGDVQWVNTALNMIGKCTITALYSVSYTYAAELYPTEVRTIGVSFGCMVALCGAVLSPEVLLSRKLWEPLPEVIFASIITIAGFLVLLLPETRGKKLMQTIGEGEASDRKAYVYVL
ncbi:organic cation transporter protein-like isoform X1 [Ptychodera flava]|uniref:organic cation transporter protein-like isoform X1 n=1 Tax=Ptychodera flava TaxID=63121 RepID=UPI003969CE0C